MRYAFPGAKVSLRVDHDAGYSRVHLYERAWGTTPTTSSSSIGFIGG